MVLQTQITNGMVGLWQVTALSVLMDLLGGEYVGEISRAGYLELAEHLMTTRGIPQEVQHSVFPSVFCTLHFEKLLKKC